MSLKRGLAIVVAPLFAYCALLQLNDPDPVRWVVIYGGAAVVTGWTIFRPLHFACYVIVGFVSLVMFLVLLPSVIRGAVFEGVEIERELLGMLMVTVLMAVFGVGHRKASTDSTD
jgi:hypothetical protein